MNIQICMLLLCVGVHSVHAMNSEHQVMQSQLIQACRDKNERAVGVLLHYNASPYYIVGTRDIPGMWVVTPLMIAAYRSHEPIVHMLLKHPSDSVGIEPYSRALYVAVQKSPRPSETVVRMMLEKGFEASGDVRLVDFTYKTYTSPQTKLVSQPIQRLICDSYGMCALFKSTNNIVGKLRIFVQ